MVVVCMVVVACSNYTTMFYVFVNVTYVIILCNVNPILVHESSSMLPMHQTVLNLLRNVVSGKNVLQIRELLSSQRGVCLGIFGTHIRHFLLIRLHLRNQLLDLLGILLTEVLIHRGFLSGIQRV